VNTKQPAGWREVINQWIHNDSIRRDILIGLTLVLLTVIAIIALLATTVAAIAGAVASAAAAIWSGKRAISTYRTRRKRTGQRRHQTPSTRNLPYSVGTGRGLREPDQIQ
jgi:phage-related minor tail protein